VAEAVEMHKHIPKAHLWVVPNGWHMPHAGGGKEADFIGKSLEFLGGEWRQER